MRRREFIGLVGAAAVWPFAAQAQQRVARIGYLGLTSASEERALASFLAGLSDLGYVEGKNLHIEFRFAGGRNERLAGLAGELIGLNVDVIVAAATGVHAVAQATRTIPIVQAVGSDPVDMGIAASLSHPGGNVTGLTFFHPELMAKRLELLKQIAPSTTRVGVLLVQDNSNSTVLEKMGAVAGALRMELQPVVVRAAVEFEGAFSALGDRRIDGLVIADHGQLQANIKAVAAFAAERRLPSIGSLQLAENGGLMGYGVNFPDLFRRAAVFVDKILKGTKAGDIPIEQATKFKLVLNLTTAKALGLDTPSALLAIADEVIE